jgi:hypothetical protein
MSRSALRNRLSVKAISRCDIADANWFNRALTKALLTSSGYSNGNSDHREQLYDNGSLILAVQVTNYGKTKL